MSLACSLLAEELFTVMGTLITIRRTKEKQNSIFSQWDTNKNSPVLLPMFHYG